VQPSRMAWQAQYAATQTYHYNGLQAWAIDPSGAVRHVYV
jgi:hypothetical protein